MARIVTDYHSRAGDVAILEALLVRTQQLRGFVVNSGNVVTEKSSRHVAFGVFMHINYPAVDDPSTEEQSGDARRLVILLASEAIQEAHLNIYLSFVGARGRSYGNSGVLELRGFVNHAVAEDQIIVRVDELVFTGQAQLIIYESHTSSRLIF